MSGMVGRRAGPVLGRHQRAVAQPLRSGERPQHRDADAGVDRLLRAAPGRRLRRRAAQRLLARACRRHARAQGRRRAVRSVASPLQRRPLRPAGPLSRGIHERAARREHGGADASGPGFRADPRPRRHDDQQRARVQSGRPHDVPRRHADPGDPRVRLRRGVRAPGEPAGARALHRRGRPPGRRRRRSRRLLLERDVPRRQRCCGSARTAACSRGTPSRRCARPCARSAAPTSGRST